MNNDISKKAASGLLWKFAEKIGYQGISVSVQIILARLLLPDDYGIIAIIMVFVALSDVFILQGLTTALIQRKNPSQLDFSSVFYANIGISIIIYICLFFSAGLLADFYYMPELKNITRVLGLNVVLGAPSAVHYAIMSRNLDFRKSFYRNITNVVCYGITGILLAFEGFGVWSLVYSKLVGTLVGSVVMIVGVNWTPSLVFSTKSLRSLFNYSSKVLCTNLFKTLFYNLNSILIGKYHPSSQLGYYQRGRQIPEMVMTSVDGSLSEVMYPTLSKFQDDLPSLKGVLRRSLKISMFVTFPLLVFLIVISEPLTLFLLTDKWLPSVPIMQLACILCMDWPLSIRVHALNAIGKSNITLQLSIIQQVFSLFILIITVRYGVIAMMYGGIFSSIVYLFVSSYFVNKYIKYSLVEMLHDIIPTVFYTIVMAGCVYVVSLFCMPLLLQLAIQVLIAFSIYVSIVLFVKDSNMVYLQKMLNNIIKR